MENLDFRKNGIIKFDGKALYWVEMFSHDDYIEVYNPQIDHYNQAGEPIYTKKYKTKHEKEIVYGNTIMGKALNKLMGRNPNERKIKSSRKIPYPPAFVADIVMGYDSFDGEYCQGFEERYPDDIVVYNNASQDITTTRKPNTGVFIGLKRIKWLDTYLPYSEIADQLRSEQNGL